ncbi:MAG: TIGR03936 family radical SAM-associated protein, partial [Proteobacteria bacterium]|nr:TIGR03936 family radical SAM-associated protein [Pseudomonadota bacterium]
VYQTCTEVLETSLPSGQPPATFYNLLKIAYSKQDQAKYFGHLELVRVFLRAIRRAAIAVRYSEGFHPKPMISFEDALPTGMESLIEHFYIEVVGNQKLQTIVERLNRQLPPGLKVLDCQPVVSKKARDSSVAVTYLVTKKDGFFEEKELSSFKNKPELIYRQTDRKGKTKEIDLKTLVLQIELLDPDRLQMTLRSEPGKSMRPSAVIGRIFSLPEDAIRQAKTVKTSSENV